MHVVMMVIADTKAEFASPNTGMHRTLPLP